MINSKNCDYITLVQCIGTANKTILPILLISRVNNLNKYCQQNDLDRNIIISITKTNYINNNGVLK